MKDLNNYYLRELSESDLELVLNWRNSKPIQKYMYTDHNITMLEHQEWFKRVEKNENHIVRLLVYNEEPIGLVTINNFDNKNNKCYWGFYIGDRNAPRGSGTIMGILALELIFENLQVRKLCAEVLENNIKSLNFHKKLGFKEEGRFVDHIVKNNQHFDVIPLALFKAEWIDVKKKLLINLRKEKYE
ncbi:UDP-4-amino-4,6-dideoxy-N-acetyl-beta-L-altrosamine N-acetyltransferase [Halalkalibacter okhensis]|uniref:N-acetyltransferase domain-containing protein n=1 Tax=Halalkalibacter okhensis TaxID=333138 RepID=A0A0B0IBG2_9BACI|nr:UDP-4-amino-4,6-dideoxy-N-acetyl-beta-L-altrosamine N-acetyltransferase [Halalkalibacter okhensis]KHF39878.1 hypothetical protein LQ50_12495 [Halalkalibacter okhensis]